MSSNEPFFRTTLSPKQRENLRLLLQLRSDEEARIAEERITDVLVFCHYAELRRRKFPKVTEAKRKAWADPCRVQAPRGAPPQGASS